MADPIPFKRPINWPCLRADQAQEIVRERAKDRGKVRILNHAYARTRKREILQSDVYWILDKGTVEGKMTYDPSEENGRSSWSK